MKIDRRIYSSKKSKDIPSKRRFSLYYNRAILAAKLIFTGIFLILIITKQINNLLSEVRYKIAEILSDYGFALENVIITGQKNISSSEVIDSLNADVGTPIFSISLSESWKNLHKNPWVADAIIQRKIPNTIEVNLVEKKPIALWQVNKELFVIDEDGEILKGVNADKYTNFIHVVGEGANIYASELVSQLTKNSELAGKIQYAVWYGQRRWDLNLEENINVKMPQYDFAEAYEYLSKLYIESKLFNNKIKAIDLRNKNKIYIERIK